MSRLLLDTTFLIDAERLAVDLDHVVGDDDDVAVAAITVAELWVGVLLATGKRQAARAKFIDDMLDTIPALHYDLATAEAHAELLAQVRASGTPRGAHDLIIAATAKTSGRIVVTADSTGFTGLTGVTVRPHR